ncbi:hypothetical protein LTR08_001512 [Meristemomyces frigidus]|nr:hypothetical protein LTR08_001512 [Meristemomyces frigidus]
MKPGDLVTILYGSMWPVILRPCPENDEYEMIGVSHVYGIMDGEAVDKNKAEGVADVTFRIR